MPSALVAGTSSICVHELEKEPICTSGGRRSWGILLGDGTIDTGGVDGFRGEGEARQKLDRVLRYIECVCEHDDWSFKCFSPYNCRDAPLWRPARAVCLACGAETAIINAAARRTMEVTLREWENKLARALRGLLNGGAGGVRVGDSLRAYRDLLVLAHEDARALQKVLDRVSGAGLTQAGAEIDKLMVRLDQAGLELAAQRVKLAPEVSRRMEEGERNRSGADDPAELERLIAKARTLEFDGVNLIRSIDGTCDGYRLLQGERCCVARYAPDLFMVCPRGSTCPPLKDMVCDPE